MNCPVYFTEATFPQQFINLILVYDLVGVKMPTLHLEIQFVTVLNEINVVFAD
jgi:hypothetical protein